jgi:hypothetical protein
MNMREMCGKAHQTTDEEIKMQIKETTKEYEKKLEECKKTSNLEKERANRLYLKYGDDDPSAVEQMYLGGDNSNLSGDDKLMYKMYDMSQMNKRALTSRALWSSNSLIPYFEEELQSHANSPWYDDDTLETEF